MVGVLFVVLAVIAILSIFVEFAMRMHLTCNDTQDKIAWWRRGGDEIESAYEELFPNSPLPVFRRFAFWFFVASCAALLIRILWKPN
jgi:hypothetical protein